MSPYKLYANQELIKQQLLNIGRDVDIKHAQNRSSIHGIKNDLQGLCDEVWKLKIKIVGLSVIAGIVTTVISSLVKTGLEHIR